MRRNVSAPPSAAGQPRGRCTGWWKTPRQIDPVALPYGDGAMPPDAGRRARQWCLRLMKRWAMMLARQTPAKELKALVDAGAVALKTRRIDITPTAQLRPWRMWCLQRVEGGFSSRSLVPPVWNAMYKIDDGARTSRMVS
jgi:hypothetical protein